MSQHFPALVIAAPLLAALIIAAAGWLNKKLCFPIAIAALALSLYFSIGILLQILQTQLISYRLGGWKPPYGIEFRIDHLNALILVLISAVAFLNLLAAKKKVEADFPDKIGAFYSLYVLFVTGLIGIVITGDAFNLYVLLEITALTGYALIGMGREHAPLASLNYVFMGTIGASFYLLGIGYLYLATGSLNMADLANLLPKIYDSNTVLFAFIFCLVGLFIKMALFPLHAWLPNAYTYSPSATSSLVAPLTTKVMIYVLIRISLFVFTPKYSFANPLISNTLVWLAVVAIVMGSVLALAQRSLTRMLTYIVVAEVGYMVGGFWLGNKDGMTGAILHIVNDAAMTLCLFLAAGSILYRMKSDKFEDLKGIVRKMPFTIAAFLIGSFSIIGVPPTCGFFSKWYLIKGGIAGNHWGFVVALLFSSLVNVIIFFRIIEIGYFEPISDSHHSDPHDKAQEPIKEAPLDMLIPLAIAAVSLVVLGLYTGDIVGNVIRFTLPTG